MQVIIEYEFRCQISNSCSPLYWQIIMATKTTTNIDTFNGINSVSFPAVIVTVNELNSPLVSHCRWHIFNLHCSRRYQCIFYFLSCVTNFILLFSKSIFASIFWYANSFVFRSKHFNHNIYLFIADLINILLQKKNIYIKSLSRENYNVLLRKSIFFISIETTIRILNTNGKWRTKIWIFPNEARQIMNKQFYKMWFLTDFHCLLPMSFSLWAFNVLSMTVQFPSTLIVNNCLCQFQYSLHKHILVNWFLVDWFSFRFILPFIETS